MKPTFTIKLIENIDEMHRVEDLQRQVWQEGELEIVPAHLMNSAVHNGGLLLGAYVEEELAGFVFGFSGFYSTPDGPRLKHYSSMLGVRPNPATRGWGLHSSVPSGRWCVTRASTVSPGRLTPFSAVTPGLTSPAWEL